MHSFCKDEQASRSCCSTQAPRAVMPPVVSALLEGPPPLQRQTQASRSRAIIARCNDAAASLKAALDTKSRRDAFNLALRSIESLASFFCEYFRCSTAICSDKTSARRAMDKFGPWSCSERKGESSSTCVERRRREAASVNSRVDSLTAASTASQWHHVALTPSTRSSS